MSSTWQVTLKAQALLRTVGCTIREVPSITSPDTRGSTRYANTYTKLNVWGLTDFKVGVRVAGLKYAVLQPGSLSGRVSGVVLRLVSTQQQARN